MDLEVFKFRIGIDILINTFNFVFFKQNTMATIAEIIQCIEQFAHPMYQESYDNSGLIVGDASKKVEKVMLALDCIEEVVDEAIRTGCQLIIAHHPIVFKGLKSLTGKNYVERTLLKAIKKDIAIYACHTNLDNVHLGVNSKIAEKLGLTATKVLAPMKNTLKQLYTYAPLSEAENIRQALYRAGAGKIGDYEQCSFNSMGLGTFKPLGEAKPFLGTLNVAHEEKEVKIEVVFPVHAERGLLKALREAHPYEEIAYGLIDIEIPDNDLGAGLIGTLAKPMEEKQFLKMLKSNMKASCVRHTQLLDKKISKVAVCGGSGSFLLKDAIRAGADVFVTADFKYHEFFDAENHLVIADIGHYESEQFTYEIFSELLLEKFTTFAVLKTSVDTNPVNYYS